MKGDGISLMKKLTKKILAILVATAMVLAFPLTIVADEYQGTDLSDYESQEVDAPIVDDPIVDVPIVDVPTGDYPAEEYPTEEYPTEDYPTEDYPADYPEKKLSGGWTPMLVVLEGADPFDVDLDDLKDELLEIRDRVNDIFDDIMANPDRFPEADWEELEELIDLWDDLWFEIEFVLDNWDDLESFPPEWGWGTQDDWLALFEALLEEDLKGFVLDWLSELGFGCDICEWVVPNPDCWSCGPCPTEGCEGDCPLCIEQPGDGICDCGSGLPWDECDCGTNIIICLECGLQDDCECPCPDCGKHPCDCKVVCDTCGKYPCACCEECGEYPCECEEEKTRRRRPGGRRPVPGPVVVAAPQTGDAVAASLPLAALVMSSSIFLGGGLMKKRPKQD